MSSYCHCCGQWSTIVDGAHCGWCLNWFREHGRLPRPGDRLKTAIEWLWEQIEGMT